MTVFIDGATLSRLLFHYLNNRGNQYGLLLGEKVSQVEDRISDSQIHTANVNSLFCISSFLPWPKDEPVYSRSGCLNSECLENLVAITEQDIVGWYSFRHKSALRPSLREMTLHQNLATDRQLGRNPEEFFLFLCTSSSSSNMSTFTCNHTFMQMKEGNFIEMPMTVLNLGDTTRKEYRKQSNTTLSHCRSVCETLQKSRGRFVQSSGEMDQVVRVNHLSSSLNKSLETIHSKLTQSEGVLGLLEAEVDALRVRIKQLEEEELQEKLAEDARKRLVEQQQERIQEDAAAEAEEKAQMEKLLKDLGLTMQQQQGSCGSEPSDGASADAAASFSPKSEDTVEKRPSTSREMDQSSSSDEKEAVDLIDSDSDVGILPNCTNKMNGQKTYSTAEPKSKPKADPFDFLAKEVDVQKESLVKGQSRKLTGKGQANGDKKVPLQTSVPSPSPDVSGVTKSSENNKRLNNDAYHSDDAASNSSNGVLKNEDPDEADQAFSDNFTQSYLNDETYIISSSPTF